jgi:outer membrane protein assembly factor BamB
MIKPKLVLRHASILICLAVVYLSAKTSNWPNWRGPESNGVSAEKNLPTEWDANKNVRWKASLPGKGHSSPIVWGNRIFLTTWLEGPVVPGAKGIEHTYQGKEYIVPDSFGADRRHTLKVLALDTGTGKVLWERTAYEGTVLDSHHRKNTYASPTPATDGHHLYAYFGPEGLYCYDLKGKLIWKTAVSKLGTWGLGPATSPVLYKNLVILQCDQVLDGSASFITALDKRSGKEVWRTERKEPVSWTTPLVLRGPAGMELVASGAKTIIAYDPDTGKELWHSKGVEMNAIPTPVANDKMVYVVAQRVAAIRLAANGDGNGAAQDAWRYQKGGGPVPSPVLYGPYLYSITDKGILTCLDAETGQVQYTGRVPVPATFTASLVAYDGKILLTSEDGDTFVLKAGPKQEILRTNALGEPVFASPAVAGGRLFIRTEKNLYCIEEKAGK